VSVSPRAVSNREPEKCESSQNKVGVSSSIWGNSLGMARALSSLIRRILESLAKRFCAAWYSCCDISIEIMLSNLPRSSSSVVPYHVPVSTKCLMPNSAATLAMTAALVGSSMASASDLPSNDWIYRPAVKQVNKKQHLAHTLLDAVFRRVCQEGHHGMGVDGLLIRGMH